MAFSCDLMVVLALFLAMGNVAVALLDGKQRVDALRWQASFSATTHGSCVKITWKMCELLTHPNFVISFTADCEI